MADKVIGELPGISYLDSGSLFVAEQQGEAVKVTGKQLTDFSNVETTAQVEQAKASAQAAKTAQAAAEAAILKGPIIQNGTWWVYNQTAGAYQNTGINATGPKGDTGPTSSVNGISPDASGNITLTAGNVGAYSRSESDALLANKAPAGYGLGGQSKLISASEDLNDAVYDGWYYFDAPPINAPLLDSVNAVGYSSMLVSNRIPSLYVTQEIFCYTSWEAFNCVLRRCRINGEWKPWEWVNPPMILGIEYRTTERNMGKPVYTKLVDFGALPNASAKDYVAGDTTCSPIRVSGYVYKTGEYERFETIDGGILPTSSVQSDYNDVWISALRQPPESGAVQTNMCICIRTRKDFSGKMARVQVWYTKKTD